MAAQEDILARLEETQVRKSSIMGFFDKVLPSSSKQANGELIDDEAPRQAIGRSEPTIDTAVLAELREFIADKKQMSDQEAGAFQSGTSVSNFSPLFDTKKQKILAYRTMYMYPDINKSVNIVTNTAVAEDESGELMKLRFKGDNVPESVQVKMSSIFDYLIHDIFDVTTNLQNMFKKFLIEGEMYVELILDEQSKNIVDFHVLPSYSTVPIFQDAGSKITGYMQYPEVIINGVQTQEDMDREELEEMQENSSSDDGISGAQYVKLSQGVFGNLGRDDDGMLNDVVEFMPNQIAYANYGNYGSSVYDVSGYLEPVRKTYNIMNTVDDALAVYRFVRAPSTRLWNVFTNGLPPTKADAYLDTVMKEFRKDYNYNPESGQFSQSGIFNSIIDDYFFAVDESGNKTTVEQLEGAMNLDQLSDVAIHKERLMQGLQIPRSRWDKELMKEWTPRNESTTGEEQQFSLLIEQLQRNFSGIFSQAFNTMCIAKGVDEKWLSNRMYRLDMSHRNNWKFWQDIEVWKTKAEAMDSLKPHIRGEDTPEAQLPYKFVFEKIFDLSAADEELRQKYMDEYEAEQAKKDALANKKEFKPGKAEDFDLEDTYPKGYNFNQKYVFGEVDEDEIDEEPLMDDPDAFMDEVGDTISEGPKMYNFDQKYAFGSEPEEGFDYKETTTKEPEDFYMFDQEEDEEVERETEDFYEFDQKYTFTGDEEEEDDFTYDGETDDRIQFIHDAMDEDEDEEKYTFDQKYQFGADHIPTID
jgi:hypothetical protein